MTFDELIRSYDPQVQEICIYLRNQIRQVIPKAEETIFEGWKNVSYGTGESRADKDLICYIAPFKDSVNLGFYRGALLKDDTSSLRGTGKLLRHIKYTDLQSIDDKIVLTMLERAKKERKTRCLIKGSILQLIVLLSVNSR